MTNSFENTTPIRRNFGFTFGRTKEGRDRDYESLEKRLAEEERARNNPAQPTPPVIPTPNAIPPIVTTPTQANLAYWTIPDVNYRGKVGNVDILKTLLDNGTAKTQDKWAEYSEQERTAGNFYTPDYPLFYATLNRAVDLKDEKGYKKLVEEMRTTLQGFSREKWLMTLTRIAYQPQGKDKIIHNFGLKDKYEVQEDFVGDDGVLLAGSPLSVYQSLLGTLSSLDRVNKVFNWLNDTKANYIWRVNSKPTSKVDERVARFSAGSGRAYLDCNRYPTGSNASLGVRFVEPDRASRCVEKIRS